MSFKKKMAAAKEFASQYVEKPFAYSVQKLVRNYVDNPSRCLRLCEVERGIRPIIGTRFDSKGWTG